ncbi:hypothetical protein BDV93DRAFT_596797 [Ceratobasidium sp. AG-I]|nr:hypothetical protein BDV93DRAFT_596797 [Ceratobasidium sp. AG-I]
MSDRDPSLEALKEVVYHVFLPPKLPQRAMDEESERDLEAELCHLVIAALTIYPRQDSLGSSEWTSIDTMMTNLLETVDRTLEKGLLIQQMAQMRAGDVLVLQIRAQNAAVLVRKQGSSTVFEVFEVQPPAADVMSTPGKLVRSFPGPAVEIPNDCVESSDFVNEISSFLCQMNSDVLDESAATTKKAKSKVLEVRDSPHPHYISELFLGILRGMGKDTQPRRVVKRIADEVLWLDAYKPWRRSPLWLVIRVALQTSLSSTTEYKHFMLFFETQILQRCLKHDSFPSELLFAMRVKMSRRFRKVEESAPESIGALLDDVFEETEQILQSRWSQVKLVQAQSPAWNPENFDMNKAIIQSLPNSRAYLTQVLNRRYQDTRPSSLTPSLRVHLPKTKDFIQFVPSALSTAFRDLKHSALLVFEASVHDHLATWTAENLGNPSACAIIASCISQYIPAAQVQYASDVVDQSIMVLVSLELWVALDKLTTSQCPLLLDYSPEIPSHFLDPLLLRSASNINRANEIQQYLRHRHSVAQTCARGSVYSNHPSPNSFSVRYFRQSPYHQELKRLIEGDASAKRNQKIKEIAIINERHKHLVELAKPLKCFAPGTSNRERHRTQCDKCALLHQASQLAVQVHEWPLPQNPLAAEMIVFELNSPPPFYIWRDVTYTLICDFGRTDKGQPVKPYCLLANYDGLASWCLALKLAAPMIVMGSTTKSFLQAHYASVRAPTTQDRVCLNLGLNFELFDLHMYTWVSGPSQSATAAAYGTFSLPSSSSYWRLNYALQGTMHTSNQVIADQHACPTDISLHEHLAFGTLRAGPHLQWMNIVRGLDENCLTFSREEVGLLHSQAAWQIGPLSTDNKTRVWHVDLMNASYGQLLVTQSRNMIQRVKSNWLESVSVRTAVLLVSRLLSSAIDLVVIEDSHSFLREARTVALNWLHKLSKKLRAATIDFQIVDYQRRVCEMAMLCRSTYDIDLKHLAHLFSTPHDISTFISCSIFLYDNLPPELDKMPPTFQMLIARDRRLANWTVSLLLEKVHQTPEILNSSIGVFWPSYQAGSTGWVELPPPHAYWVTTNTAVTDNGISQQIYLDLIEGRLLIDGNPLGRLPQEYASHPLYTRLFGQTVLDIVPATLPGMVFATRTPIEGHRVSFALDPATNNLIIQAQIDGIVFELIPHSYLADDFPLSFSSDYHHWLDTKSRTVEFRPLSAPWLRNTSNWHILFSQTGKSWMVLYAKTSSIYLLDFHSLPFQSIARQISPLETLRYLHATHSTSEGTVIDLPRMRLSFFINEQMQLESSNLHGLVVDRNQSSGTMLGLRNQLLLCTKKPAALKLHQSRIVLIPHGRVDFETVGNHVMVTIDSGSDRQVVFHQFKVDKDLQYLSSTTGLTSRLYKIYLHAVTSHCLVDPLTERTGTEEALHELSEAATFSFDQIDETQAQLLGVIDSLTPVRSYYPTHLRSMQTTHWGNLPAFSQHYGFNTFSKAILNRAKTLQLFHPLSFDLMLYVRTLDPRLLERSMRRTWFYYPRNTAACLPTQASVTNSNDRGYAGRDLVPSKWEPKKSLANWASSLAYHRWLIPTFAPCALVTTLESWTDVGGLSKELNLTYSPKWLSVNAAASWISLLNLCRQANLLSNRYSLAVCLASGAYGGGLPADLLRVLVAVASTSKFTSLAPPPHSSYQIVDRYQPTSDRIQLLVFKHARSIGDSPAHKLSRNPNESNSDHMLRRRNYYNSKVQAFTTEFTNDLAKQWPDLQPHSILEPYSAWFDVKECLKTMEEYFSSCTKNLELRSHLKEIEDQLSSEPATVDLELPTTILAGTTLQTEIYAPTKSLDSVLLSDLMDSRASPRSEKVTVPRNLPVDSREGVVPDTSRLAMLLAEFGANSDRPLRQRYGNDLEKSRRDLLSKPNLPLPNQLPPHTILNKNWNYCLEKLTDMYTNIQRSLEPKSRTERLLSTAGIWPRIIPRTLLGALSLHNRTSTNSNWLEELTAFAQSIINYQRAQRLMALALEEKREEFFRELELDGEGMAPENHELDWLLIQINSNFSIRSMQSRFATEMVSPSSKTNSVLQLNMGEGKSSVIVPIIAATLANGQRLVRVVVLKPLWRQMFQLLVSRLSGLANRRIYYLPFGRHIHVDRHQAQKIQDLYAECMQEGGILLVQPEHILSFKLMGVDRLISSTTSEGITISRNLQYMQDWLASHSRDILDESDEILHVRYQLVYTVGEQQALENQPDRWTTTQQILPLVSHHISTLKTQFPDSLKYEARSNGQFPTIRIMPDSEETIERLHYLIAEDVLEGRIPNMNLIRLPDGTREKALQFLINRNFSKEDYSRLQNEWDPPTWKGLLLLRGLIACRILVFALRDKHYRVDYGLCCSRSLLAVPFHAKDTPSLRAEFGHPDVTVVLTCLSYYYQGLTDTQLETCFELLYKLDNPRLEYDQWVYQNGSVPEEFQQLNSVNTKDREQFRRTLLPAFYRNMAVINFFLSAVVFPKQAKQFPHKLVTSGWDLAEPKSHVTTGFSGTNDNQYLLPTSIAQADPLNQSSTNAMVLTYLLQPENNHYLCTRRENAAALPAPDFMKILVDQTPEIRVLLDVGAQMLELQNVELAHLWLELRPDMSAAVFFSDEDELMVLPQHGPPTSLLSSPFAQQLDKCLVYLDDGHTRGTDLTLPRHTRAAVTLGPKVTKDRLLQGCMRMRKLGHGHSVMFFAPPEVDRQIQKSRLSGIEGAIDVLDIIRWAMLETCQDLAHHTSHWVQQGVQYSRRVEAQRDYLKTNDIIDLKKGWTISESHPLESMYGVLAHNESSLLSQAARKIPSMEARLQLLGVKEVEDPSMSEEQEREVSHEVERERQVQRSPPSSPATHVAHLDVQTFIQTGVVPSNSKAFLPLFGPFRSYDSSHLTAWSQKLLSTVDYATTLVDTAADSLSDFMRPVNWIASGSGGVLVVLSPYEVNRFILSIRNSTKVRLHIYTPRITRTMRSFSNLGSFSLPIHPTQNWSPPSLSIQMQLNLWAGQLYLKDFDEYLLICSFLGIYNLVDGSAGMEYIKVQIDGFVQPADRLILAKYRQEYQECSFVNSPIAILRELIGRRRKGMEYMRTHIGQILHGRGLLQSDFE